jgi:hypothetical protein
MQGIRERARKQPGAAARVEHPCTFVYHDLARDFARPERTLLERASGIVLRRDAREMRT